MMIQLRRLSSIAALRAGSMTAACIESAGGVPLTAVPFMPPKTGPRLIPPPTAFTRADIEAVRSQLSPAPTWPLSELPPHTRSAGQRTPRDAAVLIPLCNVDNRATLLMEIRAAGLRVHASEASFPGGRCEETDPSLVDSALRETEEELALPPSHVEILGALPPEYSLGNKSRVWPVIGFVHAGDAPTGTSLPDSAASFGDTPLPSISLSSLVPEPGEVSALLPLPLSAVADPQRQERHFFRLNGRWPYWKFRADDYIVPPWEGHEGEDKLEVWGLSGWFLSRLGVRCGWLNMPEASLPPDADDDN